MATPRLRVDNIGSKRRPTELSCSICGHKVILFVYEDPAQGDGWPKHRCFHPRGVQPFDQAVAATYVPSPQNSIKDHWSKA